MRHLFLILVMLFLIGSIGCSSKQIVKPEIIKPTLAEIPAKPNYVPVKWEKVGDKYCTVSVQDAINLLNDVAIKSGRENDLELILNGQRVKDLPKK